MKQLILSLLAIAALAAPAGTRTFMGVITDNMCPKGDHSGMRMGPTDAECAIECVHVHDASFVLYDGKEIYNLTGQKMFEAFAGKKVLVKGVLDAKTKIIEVGSVTAAK